MSAFWYLIRRTIVNTFKQSLKKPAQTILYAVLIIFVGFSMVMAGKEGNVPEAPQNLDVFAALVLAIFTLIFVLSIFQGLKQGNAIFSMSDVNFMFTSPLSSRRILLYGILRQAGILVLASLFLLAQYANIRLNFGLSVGTIGYLMLGYVLCGVCAQVLSADLYAYCAGDPAHRKRVETILKALGVLLAAGLILCGVNAQGDILGTLRSFFGADWWDYVPILGWTRAIVLYGAVGEIGKVLLFSFLMLLACCAAVLWLLRTSSDFYEDVLLSAENAHTIKQAANEGRMVSMGKVTDRAKRKMQPLKGKGAMAFFYRALREKQRKSLWFLDMATFAAIAAPLFGRIIGGMDAGDVGLWPPLLMGAYLLLFLGMNNSVALELTHPYIYTAPASSFAKLAAISLPSVTKYVVDAVIFAVLSVVLMETPLWEAVLGGITYWSIGVLFTAGVLLIQRVLGNLKNKVLIVLLYMFILILLVVPGIVLAMVLESTLGSAVGYLLSIVWNLIAAAAITAACHNLLNAMDV
ncbi:MAG: putative ABC exporter domain-containing protein [Clostridia bacterium]|nr:putative ABC exporter domain-containing protein [Clostridia bacterium]